MSSEFTPPAVEALWSRWEARFLAAGVDPIVIKDLKAEITTWDEWYPAWIAVAEETEAWAQRCVDEGHTLTAGSLFKRASMLYHYGGMVFLSDMDKHDHAGRKRVEAYAAAAPLLEVPGEPVTIDFDGVPLKGYLSVPPSDTPPPVVVYVTGWEGSKEESSMAIDEMHERGLATLTMDFPGIGETLQHLPMTGNYGPPVSAVIDFLQARDDIDPSRIALEGTSRGGLLASKGAAHDPRVAALAAVGPGYETRRLTWPGMDSLVTAYLQHLFHVDSPEAAEERVAQPDLSLEGAPGRITCPTLIVTDDQESEAQYGGSVRFYEELAATDKKLLVISGAERNGLRRVYLVRPMVADWLADKLLG